eukprot:Selendium_serpulae@DN5310_c0_g1_i1.p1
MSEVYIREPPTKGKVCLKTTAGPIDIELWPKEAPKACRNFVALCMEGYYNGTIFHRVIKDFMVQGGDPTGTGKGGDSFYGAPFGNEIHPRLKFRYRGMVGMANAGRGTVSNESQFFITLGRADGLDNVHTLFGKVTGHTVYNVLKMADGVIDPKTDRPQDPIQILGAEILWNPFDDIVPRKVDVEPSADDSGKKQTRDELKTRKKQLLSFEEEDDDDAEQTSKAAIGIKRVEDAPTSKTNDEALSDEEAGTGAESSSSSSSGVTKQSIRDAILRAKQRTGGPEASSSSSAVASSFPKERSGRAEERNTDDIDIDQPQKRKEGDDKEMARLDDEKAVAPSEPQGEERSDAVRSLQRDVLTLKKQGHGSSTKKKDEVLKTSLPDSDLMTESEKTLYAHRAKKHCQRSNRERQKDTLSRLNSFTAKLRTLSDQPLPETSAEDQEKKPDEIRAMPNLDEVVEENDGLWAVRQLHFPIDSARAYEIDAAKDALMVIDPLKSGDAQAVAKKKAAFEAADKQRRRERAKPSLRRNPFEKW